MPRSYRIDEVRGLFKELHVWGRFGQRAPNKPLLALWSIGRCIGGQPRLAPFDLVDREVGELIREFGPPRAHVHTEYPFWRLTRDSIWEIEGANKVRVTESGDPYRRDLFHYDVLGGFPKAIFNALRQDTALAEEVACSLVQAHFPSTRQADILEATEIAPRLALVRESVRYRRSSKFRQLVLEAYKFRCAVCGFDVCLNPVAPRSKVLVALDAAHIKWHQARGPARVQNGIALCALHHRLFDYGAFTLSPQLIVVVAESAQGSGSEEWLWRFDRKPLVTELQPNARPDPVFLDWHLRNVFRMQIWKKAQHLLGNP